MDARTFVRLEKKIDEFIKESDDDELKFFYGDHLAELVAKAAAVVLDGMEYTSHLANDKPVLPDWRSEYNSVEEFIKDARKARTTPAWLAEVEVG